MNASPLRVLVVHPSPDLYGADRMLVRSMQALRGAGHTVDVVLCEGDGPLLEHMRGAGFDPVVVPVPVLRKALLAPRGLASLLRGALPEVRRARAALRRHRPDVVYVNTLTLPHWLAAARLEHLPSVCHVRELESQTHPLLAWGLTAPLLLADTVVANSQATRAFLLARHPRLAGRSVVVYNGLDFPPADAAAPAQHGNPSGRSRVTVVGRLSPRKGQDVVVEALALLCRSGRDVELELVGSVFRGYEWFETGLRESAARMGVGDRLLLAGFAGDVWPAYRRADVVAVPSRLEPFGSVAVEAMAAGRPVVVTDAGGLPEIVDDGRTGVVVPAGDPHALADALAVLLDDADRRAAMAERGSRAARNRFGFERYAAELEDVIGRTARSAGLAGRV